MCICVLVIWGFSVSIVVESGHLISKKEKKMCHTRTKLAGPSAPTNNRIFIGWNTVRAVNLSQARQASPPRQLK